MGNSSNKKELNIALEKIIVKTLSNFPKNDLDNPSMIAAKIFFDRLLQILFADKEGEKRDLKNMQAVYKELETFANFVIENKDKPEIIGKNSIKFNEMLNNLIKKLIISNYLVEISGQYIENIEILIADINVVFFNIFKNNAINLEKTIFWIFFSNNNGNFYQFSSFNFLFKCTKIIIILN